MLFSGSECRFLLATKEKLTIFKRITIIKRFPNISVKIFRVHVVKTKKKRLDQILCVRPNGICLVNFGTYYIFASLLSIFPSLVNKVCFSPQQKLTFTYCF